MALPAWIWGVLNLWLTCRRGGGMMGTFTALPCAGGVGDQPAALIEAFAILEKAAKED